MRHLELILCSFRAGRGRVIQAWCCALFHGCLCPVFLQINHTVILRTDPTVTCLQFRSAHWAAQAALPAQGRWHSCDTLGLFCLKHWGIAPLFTPLLSKTVLWLRQLSACSFWGKPCVNLALLGLAISLQCQLSLSNLYVCDITRNSPEIGAQSNIKWSWTPGSG